MALSKNPLLLNFRGHIDRTIVVRQYSASGKTVISAFPNMSRVKFSRAQKENQTVFKKAVYFASSVKNSWMLTAIFNSYFGKDVSVYKQAIKEYFKNPNAPLSFLSTEKMQGSHRVETSKALLQDYKTLLQIAENTLNKIMWFEPKRHKPTKTRKHNPNHKLIRLLLAG